jgi:hypothetical protein
MTATSGQSEPAESEAESDPDPSPAGLRKLVLGVPWGRVSKLTPQLFAFGALLSTATFLARTIVVAHSNPNVARALLVNTSLTVAVQTLALQVVPTAFYAAGLFLVLVAGRNIIVPKEMTREPAILIAILAIPLITPLVLVIPVGAPAITIGLALPFAIFLYGMGRGTWFDLSRYSDREMMARRYGRRPHVPRDPLTGNIGGLWVLMLGYSILLAFSGMWLPPERVDVDGSPRQVYVLSETSTALVAFVPGNHAVLRLDLSRLSGRQLCRPIGLTTVAEKWFGGPILPPCPSPKKSIEPAP